MKHLATIFLIALAFSANAQMLSLDRSDTTFVLVQSFLHPSGSEVIRRSAPMDSARVKAEIVSISTSLAQQIAEQQLILSRLEKEKTAAEQVYTSIEGSTVEDNILEKLKSFFVGDYYFERGVAGHTLTIFDGDGKSAKKKALAPDGKGDRLLARLDDDDEKNGSVKIEGQNVALIFDLFTDGKGQPIDIKFVLIEAGLFIAEIEGETLKFQKK